MTLPVSMEDLELFPKDQRLNSKPGTIPLDIDSIRQMRRGLSRIWWSRLVISVRGFVIQYVNHDDELLFHCDDAFTSIHRYLAEEKSDDEQAEQFLGNLHTVVSFPLINETLLALSNQKLIDKIDNPWENSEQTIQAFVAVFGAQNNITYRLANGQKYAHIVFMRVLCILQERWKAEREKKKGIRFETDTEWQPDDRVVLFQTFYSGNRTWVLLDFDRYILQQWRPKGASIIFGDRFVEKKLRMGLKLCSYCGMLEQQQNQFPSKGDTAFCSPECLNATR